MYMHSIILHFGQVSFNLEMFKQLTLEWKIPDELFFFSQIVNKLNQNHKTGKVANMKTKMKNSYSFPKINMLNRHRTVTTDL